MTGQGCYGRTEQFASMLKVTSSVGGNEKKETVECIFVKGIAGSGKSFLMHSISTYLKLQGWLVLGGKFEAGLEYESGHQCDDYRRRPDHRRGDRRNLQSDAVDWRQHRGCGSL